MADFNRGFQSPKVFGRRVGKPLTVKKQELVDHLLPEIRFPLVSESETILSLNDCFTSRKDDFWLEIGFGGGEHLAWQAREHPNIGFIGAEPFINGVASLLKHLDADDIHNVRVWDDDARVVLQALPDKSLGRVFALFQDPWPKTRNAKRRIINFDLLDMLARVMRSGSEFRWATDHPVFLRWSLNQCLNHDQFVWRVTRRADWLCRPDDWPETRYEAKAVREGRIPRYFTFIRI